MVLCFWSFWLPLPVSLRLRSFLAGKIDLEFYFVKLAKLREFQGGKVKPVV
jgi:hypothetical protein